MKKNKILLDSSFLIAFLNPKDVLTKKAVEIMKNKSQEDIELLIHPLVIIETLTVLKMRTKMDDVRKYENIIFSEVFNIIDDLEFDYKRKSQWLIFFNKANEMSVVDCILLDYSIKNRLELLTFDKRLEREYKNCLTSG